jgi:small subunit ribosomal protein S4
VRRRKVGDYRLQLREKQKVRRVYGVLERQFRNYFLEAEPGRRDRREPPALARAALDNVVLPARLRDLPGGRRQLVAHGHFAVNGVASDIRPTGSSRATRSRCARHAARVSRSRRPRRPAQPPGPEWLSLDAANLAGIVQQPRRDQMPLDLNEQLVVEYYSR